MLSKIEGQFNSRAEGRKDLYTEKSRLLSPSPVMAGSDIVIEQGTQMTSAEKPRWHVLVGDFANMVKAFVGSNYLSIAYAFKQSGLVLGLCGLTLIALMTDHCCHLIVKCKYCAIDQILNRKHGKEFMPVKQEEDDNSDSDDSDDAHGAAVSEEYKRLQRNFTYGDVGKTAFGKCGLFLVNACLVFTQFGFCVAYFIFVGNTIHSIFPYTNPNSSLPLIDLHNSTPISPNASSPLSPSLDTLMLEAAMERNKSAYFNTTANGTTPAMEIFNSAYFNTTENGTSAEISPLDEISQDQPYHFVGSVADATDYIQMFNLTEAAVSTGPDLRLLVLSPLPIFLAFAFLRDVRHLSGVSLGANIAIFVGCVVTLCYLTVGYETSFDWVEFEWQKLPVFFGMVTAMFEGIGTIIPIESSMEGNRHNYSNFLHAAIFILASMLSVFGVVGYLRYGSATAQMLNGNIPAQSGIGMTLNLLLCVGVILTFPLQLFPVIEITEIYMFGQGRIFGPAEADTINDKEEDHDDTNDSAALLPKENGEIKEAPVVSAISPQVAAWKRNVLRMTLVFVAAGLAILLRDLFAYVGALTGAIGSSLLAYILPCAFHLKFRWHDIGCLVRFKDIFIIIFGILASLVSLYTTVSEIAAKFSA